MFPATNLDGFLEKYFEELNQKNWTLIPIDLDFVLKLQKSAKSKLDSNLFKIAGLAKSTEPDLTIRNDSIYWLDAESDSLTPTDMLALIQLDDLKDRLKSFFRTSISEFECHYAIYKPGQFYQKHKDVTSTNNKRVFSFVIYLNEIWDADDGGETEAFVNDQSLFKILPKAGTMLMFKSDLEHAVLPTKKNRYTLTGWYRR